MNQEKLYYYISLIDYAINLSLERRCLMKTNDFHEKCRDFKWISQEDIDLGQKYLEEKYYWIYNYQWLDNNIIQGLYFRKCKAVFLYLEKDLVKFPKGMRPSGNFTRGISEAGHNMWADELYDYAIYNACGEVEKYFNHELE
jgi:hypothetical protein